ncbi:MAG: hypothetical protein ACI9M6_000732 [Hydrogenophaga sp.]
MATESLQAARNFASKLRGHKIFYTNTSPLAHHQRQQQKTLKGKNGFVAQVESGTR